MMSDTLMRQWQMLRLIPRHPSKVSTTQLIYSLADAGFQVTPRTMQRDLVKLSEIYPLVSDERSKPFGWSWRSGAAVMDIPGMDSHTALAYWLADQHLKPLLPKTTLNKLQAHFDSVTDVLNRIPTDKGTPAWRNKVRVLHRGPNLKSPVIDVTITVPEGFDLDAYIASGELDFVISGSIKFKAIFSKEAAFHLEERPLSDDQCMIDHDDKVMLNATINDTSELRWWLLSFGDQVEVLEPKDIRSDMKNIIQSAAKLYAIE